MRQDWSWNRPAKEYIELYCAHPRTRTRVHGTAFSLMKKLRIRIPAHTLQMRRQGGVREDVVIRQSTMESPSSSLAAATTTSPAVSDLL